LGLTLALQQFFSLGEMTVQILGCWAKFVTNKEAGESAAGILMLML